MGLFREHAKSWVDDSEPEPKNMEKLDNLKLRILTYIKEQLLDFESIDPTDPVYQFQDPPEAADIAVEMTDKILGIIDSWLQEK